MSKHSKVPLMKQLPNKPTWKMLREAAAEFGVNIDAAGRSRIAKKAGICQTLSGGSTPTRSDIQRVYALVAPRS